MDNSCPQRGHFSSSSLPFNEALAQHYGRRHAGDLLRVPPGRSAWALCVRRVNGSSTNAIGLQAVRLCPIQEFPANTRERKAPSGACGNFPSRSSETHPPRRRGFQGSTISTWNLPQRVGRYDANPAEFRRSLPNGAAAARRSYRRRLSDCKIGDRPPCRHSVCERANVRRDCRPVWSLAKPPAAQAARLRPQHAFPGGSPPRVLTW